MSARLPGFFAKIRTYSAFLSLWLLNLGMLGIKLRKVCSPGFNCHGCPWATFACPIGVSAYGSAVRKIPFFALSSMLLTGALLGRLVCGFVCPFGFLQDILHKIPGKKFRLPSVTRYIKYAALALLVFILPYLFGFSPSGYVQVEKADIEKSGDGRLEAIVSLRNLGTEPVSNPSLSIIYRDLESGRIIEQLTKEFTGSSVGPGLTLSLPAFDIPDRLDSAEILIDSPQSIVSQSLVSDLIYYCKICPAGTLTATLPAYLTGKSSDRSGMFKGHILRFSILIFFLVMMVLVSRPFCQVFCPLGALYGLTARFALTGIVTEEKRCVNCGACDKVCPVDLDVRREAGGSECIACGDCLKVCPNGAIRRKIGI